MTNVELARRVGISAPPCLRRVRALEEAGYIRGYRALLNEKELGCEVIAFAMVHLSSQAEADLQAFEVFVRGQPLVRECWMLSGEIDFILKCVAPNLPKFQAFVTDLTAVPHVLNVKTTLTLRNSKDAPIVPMELAARAARCDAVGRFQDCRPGAVVRQSSSAPHPPVAQQRRQGRVAGAAAGGAAGRPPAKPARHR